MRRQGRRFARAALALALGWSGAAGCAADVGDDGTYSEFDAKGDGAKGLVFRALPEEKLPLVAARPLRVSVGAAAGQIYAVDFVAPGAVLGAPAQLAVTLESNGRALMPETIEAYADNGVYTLLPFANLCTATDCPFKKYTGRVPLDDMGRFVATGEEAELAGRGELRGNPGADDFHQRVRDRSGYGGPLHRLEVAPGEERVRLFFRFDAPTDAELAVECVAGCR